MLIMRLTSDLGCWRAAWTLEQGSRDRCRVADVLGANVVDEFGSADAGQQRGVLLTAAVAYGVGESVDEQVGVTEQRV